MFQANTLYTIKWCLTWYKWSHMRERARCGRNELSQRLNHITGQIKGWTSGRGWGVNVSWNKRNGTNRWISRCMNVWILLTELLRRVDILHVVSVDVDHDHLSGAVRQPGVQAGHYDQSKNINNTTHTHTDTDFTGKLEMRYKQGRQLTCRVFSIALCGDTWGNSCYFAFVAGFFLQLPQGSNFRRFPLVDQPWAQQTHNIYHCIGWNQTIQTPGDYPEFSHV